MTAVGCRVVPLDGFSRIDGIETEHRVTKSTGPHAAKSCLCAHHQRIAVRGCLRATSSGRAHQHRHVYVFVCRVHTCADLGAIVDVASCEARLGGHHVLM